MNPKNHKKTFLLVSFLLILGILWIGSVSSVQALTAEEIKVQIAQVQAQIAELQRQLAEVEAISSPSVWCHSFETNLGYVNKGDEVKALQTALTKQGFYEESISGIYSEYTMEAVKGFQEKYSQDILAPWGLSSGTGYLGETTRAKLNELHGCEEKAEKLLVEEGVSVLTYQVNLTNILNQEIALSEDKEYTEVSPWEKEAITVKENNIALSWNEFNYLGSNIGSPGDPDLPGFSFKVLLPPETDLSTLKLNYSLKIPEIIKPDKPIIPESPVFTFDEQGNKVFYWGEDKDIVEDKNLNTYQKDAFYPDKAVQLSRTGQKRNLKIATITVFPYQYNPVKNELVLNKEVDFTLKYGNQKAVAELRLTTLEQDYTKYLINNSQFGAGYQSIDQVLETADGYLIITTDAIKDGSSKLTDFITHKQNKNFDVYRITESECLSCPTGDSCGLCSGGITGWGVKGSLPDPVDRSHKIREWLQNNYESLNLQHALLIGNPDPYDPSDPGGSTGEVPMQMCWPRIDQGLYKESPTDLYYSELTGNWNHDGDDYYCEGTWNQMEPGVELETEMLVGRIPVYSGDYTNLDSILQKIIDYESDTGNISWRKKGLFPMKPADAKTPNWDLGEALASLLHSQAMASFRIYDQDYGLDPPPDLTPTTINNVQDTWTGRNGLFSGGVGIVSWNTHGSSTSALNIFDSGRARYLNDATPSFAFQGSCWNAHPETLDNLAYALLENGAIGTVAATRVSWYGGGIWDYEELCETDWAFNREIGCRYTKYLSQNNSGGQSLDLMRSSSDTSYPGGGYKWMNMFDYNLYGDPSVSLDIPRGSIEGTVRDEQGNPVSGATIFIHNKKTIVQTDDSGNFSLSYVVAGGVGIIARKGDCSIASQVIRVLPGQISQVNLQAIWNCGSIMGQAIEDGSNRPIPEAEIILDGKPTSTFSDQDGNFSLKGIPIETHTINAEKIGYESPPDQEIEVFANRTTEAIIYLKQLGSWVSQGSGAYYTLRSTSFADINQGWAVGYGGTILSTPDGGNTWNSQNSGTIETLEAVDFIDNNLGWVAGSNGIILSTPDGGNTWTFRNSWTGKNLKSVFFVDELHGWAVGSQGTITATTNGGIKWELQNSGVSDHLVDVHFADVNNGWVVSESRGILITHNGGNTWISKDTDFPEPFRDSYFLDQDLGWVVGNRGSIFSTVDGGGHWRQEESGTTNSLYGVTFVNKEHGWAVGSRGAILTYVPPNHAPVLAPIGHKEVEGGGLLSFKVSAIDPDGDPLTYSASNLPSGAKFDPAGQVFSWTPVYEQVGTHKNVHFEVSDGELTDSEDITITVLEKSITVTSPNGGEKWQRGTSQNIAWQSQGANKKVNIYLYDYKDRETKSYTITVGVTGESYLWTISTSYPISDKLKIKVQDYGDNNLFDLSDNYFSIVSAEEKQCWTNNDCLSTPGGELFCEFPSETCQAPGTCLDLEKPKSCIGYNPVCGCDNKTYSTDCARQVAGISKKHDGGCEEEEPLACTDSDGGINYYTKGTCQDEKGSQTDYCSGTIQLAEYYCSQATTAETYCSSLSYDCAYGCQDGACKKEAAKSLTLVSPNGGEKWTIGSAYNISWNSQGISKVNLYLYDYAGSAAELYTIVKGFSSGLNGGSYPWYISNNYPVSNRLKVGVQDYYDTSFMDLSDNYFAIIGLEGKQCWSNNDCLFTPGGEFFCEFSSGTCQAPGICVERPGACIQIMDDPVCGCDDKTYSNDCVREMAGVSKKHDGACEEGGSTIGLENIENQLASISNALSQIIERIKKLIKDSLIE